MSPTPTVEEMWRALWAGQLPAASRNRHLFRLFPSDPRCKMCNTPFRGIGGMFARALLHKRPSNYNPNFCTFCEEFARTHTGGAEVELTMLFADVRGSTTLAEGMSAAEFSRLMNRFYTVANAVLVRTDALIDKLVGDEVIGLYIPGFAGPQHASRAAHAARDLLRATGHNDPNGPWLPVGVGVHTGIAFVGAVGSADVHIHVTALGDAVNVAARLASNAAQGEILLTDATCTAAALDVQHLEHRELTLKGRTAPVGVRIVRVADT